MFLLEKYHFANGGVLMHRLKSNILTFIKHLFNTVQTILFLDTNSFVKCDLFSETP